MEGAPEERARFDEQIVRLRRSRWVLAAASIPFALIPLLAILGALRSPGMPYLLLVPHCILFGIAFWMLVWKRNRRPVREPARVAADRKGLRLPGKPLLTRA